MSKITSVLCVIDPTNSTQPALQRAAWFARKTNARLDLLVCYYDQFLSGEHFFDSRSLKKARAEVMNYQGRHLEDLADGYRGAGLDIRTIVVWDHPLYEGIVRYASSSRADIVFKDTRKNRRLGLSVMSNSDWNLIRTCPVPLWLVKPDEFSERPQIISAVDPMNEHDKPAVLDDEILRIGATVAKAVGGDVHAFHAFESKVSMPAYSADLYVPKYFPQEDFEEKVKERHQRRFERLLERHNIEDSSAHLTVGKTHEELPKLARSLDAAVVVMGAAARNKLKRIFIGATAERTLDELPCDLLIVKPAWFETPVRLEIENAAA